MSIKVKCEECGVALKIKDELAGRKANCPQCKAPLRIPSLESDDAPSQPAPGELSEEDAIFGKGFFDAEAPTRPQKLDLSSEQDDEDDEDDEPAPAVAEEIPKKKKKEGGFTAARPATTENAADIAGSLLTKTGKKNRPDEVEEEVDKVEYDFSEIKYLLTTRVLPAVGAIVGAFLLYLWLSSSESDLPPLAEVSGRVTVDGEPVPAQLMFFPSNENAEGSGSVAQCNADGTYEVYYNADVKGAVVGPNTIRISVGPRPFVETRDIVDGPNELNFDLKTQ